MIRINKNLSGKNSIRKNMLLNFLLVVILMGLTSILTYYNAHTLLTKVDDVYKKNIYLTQLLNNLKDVDSSLESYLSTKSSESFLNLTRSSETLKDKAEEIKKEEFARSESSLILKDIGSMIESYLQEASFAVDSKRRRDIDKYMSHYLEAQKVSGYISLYINKLNSNHLQESSVRYVSISRNIEFLKIINIVIIIFALAFNIIYIFWSTFRIAEPIVSLSRAADEISKGNFEVDVVNLKTHDEISVLSKAFNGMVQSIKTYVNEIEEKASIENKLKEQEMQNLRMKHILKDAELKSLQSQINPHFIFNTLNAGVQLAILEDAEKTSIYMENVAKLLRYNLRKMDKPVSLREEIENIKTYIYILNTRFGEEKIRFVLDIDENVLGVLIPCMVLQPLVENAFIHGVDDLENNGIIGISVKRLGNGVRISISDNGKGMENSKIEALLNGDDNERPSTSGHTTGIAIQNVIKRLRLFFSKEDVFNIQSRINEGTTVTIDINL